MMVIGERREIVTESKTSGVFDEKIEQSALVSCADTDKS